MPGVNVAIIGVTIALLGVGCANVGESEKAEIEARWNELQKFLQQNPGVPKASEMAAFVTPALLGKASNASMPRPGEGYGFLEYNLPSPGERGQLSLKSIRPGTDKQHAIVAITDGRVEIIFPMEKIGGQWFLAEGELITRE